MENLVRNRILLGGIAVAALIGVCALAIWSVNGRLHVAAPVASPAPANPLAAENDRLRAEIARVTAERDAALSRLNAVEPKAPAEPAVPVAAAPEAPSTAVAPPPAPPQAPEPGAFAEPQTFNSTSTANVH